LSAHRAARQSSAAARCCEAGGAGRRYPGLCALTLALGLWTGAAAATVTLEGLEDDPRLADNVLAFMNLDDEPCDAPEWRIRQEFQGAPDAIRTALEAFGFYEVKVSSSLELAADCWKARFEIAPGAPVTVRTADIALDGEARDDSLFMAIVAAFPLKVGAALDQGTYQGFKQRLLDAARSRGYARAAFSEARIDVYPEQHAADVKMVFDSGPRYHFGEISLEQDVLDERLVRAYLDFKSGDPYDNRKLTSLYVALTDSGYFSTIDIRPLAPIDESRAIPVEVSLEAGTRRIITYGAGYSTDVGPRLRIGRTNRRRNSAGHQGGINIELSPVISEASWNYRFPYGDPRTEWVSFETGVKREHTDTVYSKSAELSARRIVARPRGWSMTQSLAFIAEDFEVADQPGSSELLMPGLAWSKTEADNAVRPTNGSRRDLQLRAANDRLASDVTFLQVTARGKWIWSLPRGARFLVRSELGFTLKDRLEDLPPSVRFFAGGDASVRGYEFDSLGPQDADGKVIGGSRLVVGSFEFEQPLVNRWSLAFFVDSGNAFEDAHVSAQTGAGFGVRWLSPLGPIRADIGFPLDGERTAARLHISLGPDL
jgi:translocation and assembly module TamA